MSYLYILLTSVLLAVAGVSDLPHPEIERAFNANDAGSLVALTNDKVLLSVLGKDGAYSKPQAKLKYDNNRIN